MAIEPPSSSKNRATAGGERGWSLGRGICPSPIGEGSGVRIFFEKYKLKLPIVHDFCEQIYRSITDDVDYTDVNKIATEYNKVVNYDKK